MVRERVSKADLDRLRAEREARAWRKANVGEIYPHNDLLWSPPVRPRRRGRVAKGDEKLLSRFELAIAAAVISKARVVRRDAVHKEAMRRARTDMAAEQQNRAHYFRQWTDHKNDHGHGWERKPTIGDSVKAVGKRSYDSWMDC
jgi:hypothetical protein